MKKIIILFSVVFVFGLVSEIDYDDEIDQATVYCDNVAAGYWPDYNHNAADICKK